MCTLQIDGKRGYVHKDHVVEQMIYETKLTYLVATEVRAATDLNPCEVGVSTTNQLSVMRVPPGPWANSHQSITYLLTEVLQSEWCGGRFVCSSNA